MERLLISQLLKWKESHSRKPLVLEGARQVGKTWLLKEFGRKYFKDVCYINFEQSDVLGEVFAGDLSPQRIIEQLSIYNGKLIEPEQTLIIFDEVQEMPRALTSLKYFCEEAPEYVICCAGSLLGIALHEGTSFPVGKTDFLHLYPLSFKEFLIANEEKMLVDYIDKGNRNLGAFENRLTDYLKKYMIIGGMPAVVMEWLDSKDYNKVNRIQQELIAAYQKDFSKHAPNSMVEKIRYIWNSIPSQLAKENKKFMYGVAKKGGRAKDFEVAIQWLMGAGLVYKSELVKEAKMSLKYYVNINSFKLFLLDCGLLGAMSETAPESLLVAANGMEEAKGAFTQNYVMSQLVASRRNSEYYYSSGNKLELDFLIQHGTEIVPIEAKAEENLRSKLLASFVSSHPGMHGIRFSMSDYREQEWMTNIPLYAVFVYF